jgi:hypothetical protein
MSGRLTFLAALLFLTSVPSTAQAPDRPLPKCRDFREPSLRICTELDAKELGGLGRSTLWTIRIEGARPGVKIRLHNHSPAVVRVEGGNDQVVSIGRSGAVQRKVTSISTIPGSAPLDATPYNPAPERESAILAEVLVPLLQRAEARFVKGRERLSDSDYSVESVGALLRTTESELLDTMNYPELAALRGYVQVKFREARTELAKAQAPAKATEAVSRPRVLPALWTGSSPRFAVQTAGPPPAPRGALQKELTDSVLDKILGTIHRLLKLSRTSNLYTRLCIVSAPGEGARFMMRPEISDTDERAQINTNGELQAFRGLYVFSIRKGFKKINCEKLDREDCTLIDLVDDPKPIFHCDFKRDNCERRPGPVPAGICHGNGP